MNMRAMSAIEAVIWDLGGVILRTEDRSRRVAWEQRLGLREGELDRLVFAEQIGYQAALGQAGPDEVWHWVGERLGLSPEDLRALRHEFWQGDQIDAALVAFIRQVRSRHRTALLSNAWPGMRQMLEGEWAIADAFDELFISAELGLAKPDPAVYQVALERLGIQPEQAVFVDDFLENVQTASQLGIHAVHFQSAEQAMRAVDQLLNPLH